MVSIKRFLGPGIPKPEDYVRLLQLLLKGISLHAVEANESDLTEFRQEVSRISAQLSGHSSAEEIEAAVGFVTRAVAGYNRIAARMSQAHLQEMQAMLAMMTGTIAFLSDSSKTGVAQLHLVEQNLQKASSISDIRVLRSKLDECLTMVRSESNRLRDESHAHLAVLHEGLERTANHVRSAGVVVPQSPERRPAERVVSAQPNDPATGLKERGAAEQLIAASIAQGKQLAVGLFLVNGFGHLSARFGGKTSGEVLLAVARYGRERLDGGSLFRWSGPALAVIVEIGHSFQEIEQQIANISSMRLEKTTEKNGRLVLLPITCSYLVVKVSDADSVESVAETLDDFVAAKAGERMLEADCG